jgi:hypothetical protein
MQYAAIRQDANNHLVQGLHAFFAQKTIEYDADAVSAQASLVVAPGGTNDQLTFTAVPYGAAGNDISIEYVDPVADDAELTVVVDGNSIVFNLATDSGGVITTTADDIKTALLASAEASALVTAADSGGDDGSGVVDAVAADVTAGGAGNTLFEVTGDVAVALFAIVDDPDDMSGAGSIEVGQAADTDILLAATAASALDAGKAWIDNSPAVGELLPAHRILRPGQDIRDKVTINTVTGVVKYYVFWYPLSDDAELIPA